MERCLYSLFRRPQEANAHPVGPVISLEVETFCTGFLYFWEVGAVKLLLRAAWTFRWAVVLLQFEFGLSFLVPANDGMTSYCTGGRLVCVVSAQLCCSALAENTDGSGGRPNLHLSHFWLLTNSATHFDFQEGNPKFEQFGPLLHRLLHLHLQTKRNANKLMHKTTMNISYSAQF